MSEVSLVLVFIFGLCIGSFLNVVIDRLSEGKTLMGRSMCDYCERVLRPLELVPVLSFLVQRGFSTCCGKKLSWQYPSVELLTGVVFLTVWFEAFVQRGDVVLTVASLGIASALIVITIADLKYRIIPDAALIAMMVFTSLLFGHDLFKTWPFLDRALAGAVLFSGMAVIYAATRGRGLGFGDVKFAGVIGYLFGLQQGFIALYIAFISGGLLAIVLLLTSKKGLKSEVPFGPFMVWGILAVLLFGKELDVLITKFF